jgi:RimJ/RimL family protein N-acetyltransferase
MRESGFKALNETAPEKDNPREKTAFETMRLAIRRFRPDDWQDLYEYLSQPKTVYYEPYEPFSQEQAKQEAVRRSADESFYAVCLKESGKVIGNIYLAKRDFDAWEIGFVFNAKFQGKGYAAEAAAALLDKLFSRPGAHRVFAECNPENERSWKLLERLRFRREGHVRQNIYFKRDAENNPLWQDTYMYGILDSEWRTKEPYAQ